MNDDLVSKIAHAVLYEGYILYPYRPSVKNRQRWTFGGVVPESYAAAAKSGDASTMQTQCIATGPASAVLTVKVRFLHLTQRIAGRLKTPFAEWPTSSEPTFDRVDTLDLGDRQISTWQEAEEREIPLPQVSVEELAMRPRTIEINIPGNRRIEPQRDHFGSFTCILVRQQESLAGTIEMSAEAVASGVWKITLTISNTSLMPSTAVTRDDAMLFSFASTHSILHMTGGDFVSLTDPPEPHRALAATCINQGTWPILVGSEGQRDTLLASPIILSDYPQIAPESPGDLFDSAEIDEILTLRIMTLTDDEKRNAAFTDDRTRALLARTDALARDQLMNLHGAMRHVAPHAVTVAKGSR